MPIHLIWGDDEAARSRAVETLVNSQVDPSWQSINLSRLDGNDANQAAQALEEARTAPFGAGDRVIVLQRSPFCNQCPADLAEQLEATLNLVAEQCHLVLVNAAKPDGRLKTTKSLQKLVKSGEAKLSTAGDLGWIRTGGLGATHGPRAGTQASTRRRPSPERCHRQR